MREQEFYIVDTPYDSIDVREVISPVILERCNDDYIKLIRYKCMQTHVDYVQSEHGISDDVYNNICQNVARTNVIRDSRASNVQR